MLYLWLDDIRLPPEGWEWHKTIRSAITRLEGLHITGEPITVSFDHDLGEIEEDGYQLAKYFEGTAASGKLFNVADWRIHSANPVGRARIAAAMQSYERLKAAYGI